jgi:hypothetical protein
VGVAPQEVAGQRRLGSSSKFETVAVSSPPSSGTRRITRAEATGHSAASVVWASASASARRDQSPSVGAS